MANIVRDWTKQLVPKVNDNNLPFDFETRGMLRTTDFVSIKSVKEICPNEEKYRKSVTDFGLMNGCAQARSWETQGGKPTGLYWLRSVEGTSTVYYVNYLGRAHNGERVDERCLGLCPTLSLVLPSKYSLMTIDEEIGDLEVVLSKDGEVLYHTIKLGEYPKTRVGSSLHRKLESMYNYGDLQGGLKCTGRLFTTCSPNLSDDWTILSKQNPEFEYMGEKYVRTMVWPFTSSCVYNDGTNLSWSQSIEWVKVEPITFKIDNYDELASGKAKTLELESEEIILGGLPFYPDYEDANCGLWQNSMIRAFLNSARSNELDGAENFRAWKIGDFRNSGFLHQALNMTREPTREYVVPYTESEICDYAFNGCVGLEKITILPQVTKIGAGAFLGCVNAQVVFQSPSPKMIIDRSLVGGTKFKYVYISKAGGEIVFSPRVDRELAGEYFELDYTSGDLSKYFSENYKQNLVQLANWRQAGLIKFIPPEFTMHIFPSDEIRKYFINNNNQRWGKLVKTLGFDTLEGDEKNNSLADLMKIYYALGGFSDNQGESEKAFEYILNHVATTRRPNSTPSQVGQEIHSRFSKIKIKSAYNPTFAKFFMKYYHQNPDFMNFRLPDKDGCLRESQDYLCMAHNAFDSIMRAYPNRVVNGNEERALLSPRFVAEHSGVVEYDYVDDGNEVLAELVGRYGYDEEQFEQIQEIYNEGKKLVSEAVICADRAKGKNGITFRVLEKDDPLGFVLGDITNCCQHIGGAAESCVEDGYKNPNAGFLVFEEDVFDDFGKNIGETRVLGQAYIWYDPQTKTVCYDNIEIPKKVREELKRGDKHGERLSSKALMDVVAESADAIMLAMNRKGVNVERVTTGRAYNDLKEDLRIRFGEPECSPKSRHRGYNGYSDANDAQFVIGTYNETTKKYADEIRTVASGVYADLKGVAALIQERTEGGKE